MRHVRHYLIRPLDSWFLRDGRPFEQEDEGMAEVRSVFPPFPPTVVGALRAAMARAMGWDGCKPWDARMTAVLGDGPECTGQLRFGAPLVVRRRGENGRWAALFPAPRHLLRVVRKEDASDREEEARRFRLLRPGTSRLDTDVGRLPLPETESGLKDCEGFWLSAADLSKVLAGGPPECLVQGEDLHALEYRVGLQRKTDTRTAVPGMLYAVHHVRLPDGFRMSGERLITTTIGLAVGVETDDPAPPDPEPLGPFGGFRRPAVFEPLDEAPAMPREPEPPEDGRYIVVLLSPARFHDLGWNHPGGEVPGLPGRLVFACTGRPVMIGGWNSVATAKIPKGPLPLRPHLPAGSVLFLEGDPGEVRALFADGARRQLGEAGHLGFGRFVVGRWPQGDLAS